MRYFKMEKRFLFCLLFLFLAINVSASESIPAPPQEQPIALINAVNPKHYERDYFIR